MSKMQRDKGARYERLISKVLSKLFPDARRGNQKMGAFQPDIVIPTYWVECTHGKTPRVYSKIKQANKDLTACDIEHRGKIPLIIHRKNNGEDYVTIELDHFMELLEDRKALWSGDSGPYHLQPKRCEEYFGHSSYYEPPSS